MKKIAIIIILIFFGAANNFAQNSSALINRKAKIFLGYDLGEMALNKFQNFAGEAGVKFDNDHSIRFIYLNVKLTEEHLSSGFANAVDGDQVKGLWQGYDLVYDLPVFHFKGSKFIYAGLSAGYHKNFYEHTVLDESIDHQSATIGFDIGYREANIFKIKGLYFNFQIPFRYNFNALEETKLGTSTVNKSVFGQTISFFIGYEF